MNPVTDEDRERLRAAYAAWDAEDWRTAAEQLEALLSRHPDHRLAPGWWFDAALAYKFLRDWPKAYALGIEAAKRETEPVESGERPAQWNLAIAATVVEDWATARTAWRAYGMDIPDGDGEIDGDFGPTPIRLDPDNLREVVWARRICPTRARVTSVPVPGSGRRYGEIVLHDGVPNGTRTVNGRQFSVFDEIQLWRPSEIPTLTVQVTPGGADGVEALLEAFQSAGFGAEPAAFTKAVCSCCSHGDVTQDRDVEGVTQQVNLGAPESVAREILEAWQAGASQARAWAHLTVAD